MPNEYQNFRLALYCPAGTFNQLSQEDLERDLDFFQRHLRLSKVYLESHRGTHSLDHAELRRLKQFFESRGLQTAGGITATLPADDASGFTRLLDVICYTDEASRNKLRSQVEVAASVFDEIILDDFFFTNCACDRCIARRGERSWRDFRRQLMTEVSEELVKQPARSINPRVKLVIKYPNWCESYAGTGYDTLTQPQIFDGVYGGTETRDPTIVQQNMPRYASYSLIRWLEAANPGKSGGGWFDALDCSSIDNYLEQAYLTLLGKAREMTLYSYELHRDSVYVPALGFQLDKLDTIAGALGSPIGVTQYLPHHGQGEDHLGDYLGMLGIPIAPTPHFPVPANARVLLLTQAAADDPALVDQLEAFLIAGGQVVVTSGLIERLWGKGIERLTSLRPTHRWLEVNRYAFDTLICTFDEFHRAARGVVFPALEFDTNATWQCIVGFNGETNVPLLTSDHYGRGSLSMLAVPHNFADLSRLPASVIDKLRERFCVGLPAQLLGPADVGLFLYDNDALVVESFAPSPTKWDLRVADNRRLVSLFTKDEPPVLQCHGEESNVYRVKLLPRTFRAYRLESVPSASM